MQNNKIGMFPFALFFVTQKGLEFYIAKENFELILSLHLPNARITDVCVAKPDLCSEGIKTKASCMLGTNSTNWATSQPSIYIVFKKYVCSVLSGRK